MIRAFVELSHESLELAEAETVSATEALGGRGVAGEAPIPGLVPIEIPDDSALRHLADRLALARRCLTPLPTPDGFVTAARREGGRGGSAAFRRIGRPSGGDADEGVLACGRAFKLGGGAIDLDHPLRRFWLAKDSEGRDHLLEEVATIDRSAPSRRRMPLLPFRRPVSLPPRLSRVAVNLARVTSGDRVLDPFLGTGALLAEAGLLGGRLYGIDRDPTMVRGALQNFAHLGVAAEELLVGDAREVEFSEPSTRFSAIVTDAPYGRSASTGGAALAALVEEVTGCWSDRLTADGRLLLIAPESLGARRIPGALRYRIAVRVHRSLTREFRLYERAGLTRSSC
jgi:SAM-dependent methyltransferase